VADADGWEVVYLTMEDFYLAAAEALQRDVDTVRPMTNETLAGSALAAPAAGFGDFEKYPDFATKTAVLLQAVASNHALPDGNKRTALLCAILFAALNGYRWIPPYEDDPDGTETAEVVEAVAARSIPLGALSAWVELRLDEVPPSLPERLTERPPLVIYPAEYVGGLAYADNTIEVGDLKIHDVHGYNPAGVYVRRISGKTDGISVAEIIISVVGDGYAQEELDAENAEAERYPLGVKEYWRSRLVGKATYGVDGHPLTDEEFEADWAESEET
jgi:death on curing protein